MMLTHILPRCHPRYYDPCSFLLWYVIGSYEYIHEQAPTAPGSFIRNLQKIDGAPTTYVRRSCSARFRYCVVFLLTHNIPFLSCGRHPRPPTPRPPPAASAPLLSCYQWCLFHLPLTSVAPFAPRGIPAVTVQLYRYLF